MRSVVGARVVGDEKLWQELQRIRDEMIMSAFIGPATTTVAAAWPPSEPFTRAKLQKMIALMPPRETLLSTRLMPTDHTAVIVKGSGENFTVAHPHFWTRVMIGLRRHPNVHVLSQGNPLLDFDMTPIEIDPWQQDDEETAEWRASHWDRLREAFEIAMIPLPEWLRSPPKFGKHE